VNIVGVLWGGRLQMVITVIKAAFLALIAILPFVLIPFVSESIDVHNYSSTVVPRQSGLAAQVGVVLLAVMWAYNGWHGVTSLAEEVREPQRTIPIGLITAMAAAAILYIAVAITAVSVVPWQELAAAPGPITEVVSRAAPIIPPILFTGITLFAVANTGLVNFVTASRLIYGMGRQGLLPSVFGRVHHGRRTPHIAIVVLFLTLVPLALSGTIAELASATVLLLLAVFAVVNGSLFVLKGRKSEQPGQFEIPRFVPALGAIVCLALIVVRVSTGDWRAPAIAGGLLLGCFAIYLAMRMHTLPVGRALEHED